MCVQAKEKVPQPIGAESLAEGRIHPKRGEVFFSSFYTHLSCLISFSAGEKGALTVGGPPKRTLTKGK